MDHLPNDLVLRIAFELYPKDVLNWATSSSFFQLLVSNQAKSLWASFLDQFYPGSISESPLPLLKEKWGNAVLWRSSNYFYQQNPPIEGFGDIQSGSVLPGHIVVSSRGEVVLLKKLPEKGSLREISRTRLVDIDLPNTNDWWIPSCAFFGDHTVILGGANPCQIEQGQNPVFVCSIENEELKQIGTLRGHTGRVVGMACKGNRLVTVSWGGNAFIWDFNESTNTFEQIADLSLASGSYFSVDFNQSFVVIGQQSGSIKIFNATTYLPYDVLFATPSPLKPYVLSVKLTQDGLLLASDSEGNFVCFEIRVEANQCCLNIVEYFSLLKRKIRHFHRITETLFAIGQNTTIALVDLKNGQTKSWTRDDVTSVRFFEYDECLNCLWVGGYGGSTLDCLFVGEPTSSCSPVAFHVE